MEEGRRKMENEMEDRGWEKDEEEKIKRESKW